MVKLKGELLWVQQYTKLVGDHFISMVLYVNDMLFLGNNKEIIKDTCQNSVVF